MKFRIRDILSDLIGAIMVFGAAYGAMMICYGWM